MQKTISISVEKSQIPKVLEKLRTSGLEEISPKSQYELARLSTVNCVVIAYASGKVVVQGKDINRVTEHLRDFPGCSFPPTDENDEKYLEIKQGNGDLSDTNVDRMNDVVKGETIASSTDEKIFLSNTQNWSPRIGSDEVGKGDYFGPMVVAACYVDEKSIQYLQDIGVMDSKKLTDLKILDIFSLMRDLFIYEVEVLQPSEYNEQHSKVGNVAVMLARLHDTVLKRTILRVEKDKRSLKKVVIDQFSASSKRLTNELSDVVKNYPLEQFHKGESDPSVAAASVIARAFFLKEWDQMEKKYDMDIPKGATNVIRVARAFVDRYGSDELSQVAKVSFKTTKKVLA